MIILLFIFLGIGYFFNTGVICEKPSVKWHHPLRQYDDEILQVLGTSNPSLYEDFNRTLDKILLPRAPGTTGHEQVQQNILDEMNGLGWSVTQDQFEGDTPHGKKAFSNIIATADSKACRNLVIACHYDSLHKRQYTFLGATDSAVPCAMMIHLAKILNPSIQKNKRKDLTLQLIFFDGEEAFKHWSDTDSLYGSRHLAEKWKHAEPFPNSEPCVDRVYKSYLNRMDVLVLLDLLGGANPKFRSFFSDTSYLYTQFVEAERRLSDMMMLDNDSTKRSQYFNNSPMRSIIEDDHIPFMEKGVPILHLIPYPFPSVWHRNSDNRENLHHPTIDNLNKILRIFVARYLHLDVPQEQLILNSNATS